MARAGFGLLPKIWPALEAPFSAEKSFRRRVWAEYSHRSKPQTESPWITEWAGALIRPLALIATPVIAEEGLVVGPRSSYFPVMVSRWESQRISRARVWSTMRRPLAIYSSTR